MQNYPQENFEKTASKAIKEARTEHYNTKHLAIMSVVNLIFWYGVAFGIWGLVFKLSFPWFILIGITVGLLVVVFCSAPLFFMRRTPEHVKDTIFFVGIWVKIGIIIGTLGLLFWIIKTIFFH